MSVQHMGRVWESDLDPNLKLVGLALADHADDRGWCWPSIATIAAKTGYSRRQTQRLVRQLVDLGYVTIHEPATHVRSPTYRLSPNRLQARRGDNLTPPHRDQRREFEDDERGDISDVRGDTDVTSGVTPETPRGDTHVTRTVSEPPEEPSSEPSEAPLLVAEIDSGSIERFRDHVEGEVEISAPVRPRNPLWDALAELFGYTPVGSEARLWGKLVKELAEMDADPADVPIRAERLALQWGPDKLTPTSLVKHWQRYGTKLGAVTMTDRDRDEFIDRRRLDEQLDALPDHQLGMGGR